MATPGSTLTAKPPLKVSVEDLGVLDQITHLGKQFSKEEKKEYFDSLPNKKYKIGLIRNKELDIVIKIFTESFDFSKKINAKIAGINTYVSKECKNDNTDTVVREDRVSANLRGGANDANEPVDPYANNPADANDPYENAESLNALPENGFNRTGNVGEQEIIVPPETIGTSSDFERLYLGWMNNPELALTDEEKQKRKNSMKSLFRFIFGTKNISDVTATTLQKKLRLAYTPLTHDEKLPCEDSTGGVWIDFRESLIYRRKLAMCELFAARDVLGGEQRLYIDRKKELALGLRDLIDVLNRQVYPCMLYAYDGSQHEEEVELMNDMEFSRILKVFRTFVKDKKEGRSYYSLTNLKKELSKKDSGRPKETAQVLYAELLVLLTWMAGEAEAQQKIQGLEANLGRMRNVATRQKENITELENLVLMLTVLLAMSEKIHKLILALAELKCQVEKCCNHKRAEKLARAAAVKTADIRTLEQEIAKTKEEYGIMVNKLQKTIGQQTDDIQDLEELVLLLAELLIGIEKFHAIKMSLAELRAAVKECCDKQKKVKEIQAQLSSLKKVLLRKDQNAQTLAAQTMADQGLQFAATAGSELEKQIAELEQRIKLLITEDMKKGKKIEVLQGTVTELEDIIHLLTQVIVETEKLNTLKMNLSELRAAVESCCEKKKRVDTYTTQLDTLRTELLRKDQNAETLAAQTKVEQGLQFADTAGSELDTKIAELELRIKTLMAEDARKGERIDLLEGELAEKSVIIKELEEVTTALMAVIVGIKEMNDIERDLSSLRVALTACCERKKKTRECKEQLERLESQIRALIQKEGATKELEEALETARESHQKAEEAGAALKGQIDGLREELEEVVGSSKAQLDDLRSELRGEVDKETSHAAELAARIAELEGQILSAQGALNEATEGRAVAERALAAARNTSAAEAIEREKLKKNLNMLRIQAKNTAAGYEAVLVEAQAARAAAVAEAEARQVAADEELAAAKAAAEAVRAELEAARSSAAAEKEDLEAQLGLARLEVEVTMEDAQARIAEAAAAIAGALGRAAEAEAARAAVASNRNKLAANLKAAQESADAAAAVLEDIMNERDRANRELTASTIELGATRANRNAAKGALDTLKKEMEQQSADAATAAAEAEAAVAAARAEAETAVGASVAERDAIAAELARRIAERDAAIGAQAEKEAELAKLQAVNAGLAGQLAAVSEGSDKAAAEMRAAIARLEAELAATGANRNRTVREVQEELEKKKAELLRVEEAAREAVSTAVEEHKKKIAELLATQEKALVNIAAAASAAANAEVKRAREEANANVKKAREEAARAVGEARVAADERVKEAEAAALAARGKEAAEAAARLEEAIEAAARAKEEADRAREEADRAKKEAANAKGEAASAKEEAANAKGEAASAKKEAANAKGEAASAKEEAAAVAADAEKEAARIAAAAAEEVTRAKEEAAAARAEAATATKISIAQETELDSLRRKSEALADELAAMTQAAKETTTSAASQIDFLTRRIEQLQGESDEKNAIITHLEDQTHQLQASAQAKKSVFNRLSTPKHGVPLRAPSTATPPAKPAWRSGASPSEYSKGVIRSAGVGKTSAGQQGGAPTNQKKSFCDTMLALLLLELSQETDINPDVFMKKAGTTLDELGQCPLVLRALSEIIDEALGQKVPEDGYMFVPTGITNTNFAEQLKEAYEKGFTEEEKQALLHSAPPIVYFSKAPEQFEGILGNRPYFLNGEAEEAGKEMRLRGVDLDEDEDPVMMTGEERELVEKDGVPLGAVLFLYLSCLKDHEEEDGDESGLKLRAAF